MSSDISDLRAGNSPYIILLVEDTENAQLRLKRLLKSAGLRRGTEVQFGRNSSEGLSVLKELLASGQAPDLVIVDILLIDRDFKEALGFVSKVRDLCPRTPIVLWSKHLDRFGKEFEKSGASRQFNKFSEDEKLVEFIKGLVEAPS